LQGALYELPQVLLEAREALLEAQCLDRCELIEGDFFTSVPGGADTYLLKGIIHDWTDEEAIRILSNCRKAMTPNAKLLLVEFVVPPGNDPSLAKICDVIMLVMERGRERTEEEFRDLFKKSGFELRAIHPSAAELCILE